MNLSRLHGPMLLLVLAAACRPPSGDANPPEPLIEAGDACFLVEGAQQCGVAAGVSSRLVCKKGAWYQLQPCDQGGGCVVVGTNKTSCAPRPNRSADVSEEDTTDTAQEGVDGGTGTVKITLHAASSN